MLGYLGYLLLLAGLWCLCVLAATCLVVFLLSAMGDTSLDSVLESGRKRSATSKVS